MDERREDAIRREVINELLSERLYQVQRWGIDQDKRLTEWLAVLVIYMGKAAQELPIYKGPDASLHGFRKRIVQIGATCMAILEALVKGK